MHLALQSAEISRLIFDQLLPDNRGSILSLTLTTKALYDSGTDSQWAQLDDVRPIFSLLSLHQIIDGAEWSDPLKEQWQRFDHYAKKIRVLDASLAPRDTPNRIYLFPSFVWNFTRNCSTSGRLPALPNLRVLKLWGDMRAVSPLALTLISPRLTTFHIACHDNDWVANVWSEAAPLMTPTEMAAAKVEEMEELDGADSLTVELGSQYILVKSETGVRKLKNEHNQTELLKALVTARPKLTSLQLCGPFGTQFTVQAPQLEWSRLYPWSLQELTVERGVTNIRSLVKHIGSLPDLKRLAVHSCFERHGNLKLDATHVPMMPQVQHLICAIDTFRALVEVVPEARKVTIQMTMWSLRGFPLEEFRSLLEEWCPNLESFVLLFSGDKALMESKRGFTTLFEMAWALKRSWDKIRLEWER